MSPSGEMAVSLNRHGSIPFTRTGTLARLGMTGGGTPKEILEDVLWADWAPDGQSLAIVRQQGGKVRLEYPVGKVLYETAGWISHPRISPKGDEVAFLDHPAQGDDAGTAVHRRPLRQASLDLRASSPAHRGSSWSPDGSEVWFTAASEGFTRALRAASPLGPRPDPRAGDRRPHDPGRLEERASARHPGESPAGDLRARFPAARRSATSRGSTGRSFATSRPTAGRSSSTRAAKAADPVTPSTFGRRMARPPCAWARGRPRSFLRMASWRSGSARRARSIAWRSIR